MIKILNVAQTRQADKETIDKENISSYQLMERAARACADYIIQSYHIQAVEIMAGMGNNGGDGLAIARLLKEAGFPVKLSIFRLSKEGSEDFEQNLARLEENRVAINWIEQGEDWQEQKNIALRIDALFGSGLNRPLEGELATLTERLNKSQARTVAIDIPSGLFADDNSGNDLSKVWRATETLTFQHPKKAFFHPATAYLAGQFQVMDIGLDEDFYRSAPSDYFFLEREDARLIFKPRTKFSYKNKHGHALLVAGQEQTMGAALLASKAALRSGAGLLSASIPSSGLTALNAGLPESIYFSRKKLGSEELKAFSAVAVGPGIGTDGEALHSLEQLSQAKSLIVDADGLNLIAQEPAILDDLPRPLLLTPHPGEWQRLSGCQVQDPRLWEQLQNYCREHQLHVILKNTYSAYCQPSGQIYFADFGSPALAKGGSGDLLTGIILGLSAQGYPFEEASILALYLQGKASQIAAKEKSLTATLTSDIVESLTKAFQDLEH